MDRRTLLLASLGTVIAGSALAEPASARRRQTARRTPARPPAAPEGVAALAETFPGVDLGPDGAASAVIIAEDPRPEAAQPGAQAVLWRAARRPDAPMFAGGALNGVILAGFLRQVEQGGAALADEAVIDDSVRSLPSPVFGRLTGRAPCFSVLEAMIAHGDNTAADVALAVAGPAAIRKFLQSAGFRQTHVPASTREMLSWMAGGAAGVNPGWEGLQAACAAPVSPVRSPLGEGPAARSTAAELAEWSRNAFAGRYFGASASLAEFARIMAMGAPARRIAPADVPAWGTGGGFSLGDFHGYAVAGRMLAGGVPVTFSLLASWRGGPEEGGRVAAACETAARDLLAETRRALARA